MQCVGSATHLKVFTDRRQNAVFDKGGDMVALTREPLADAEGGGKPPLLSHNTKPPEQKQPESTPSEPDKTAAIGDETRLAIRKA